MLSIVHACKKFNPYIFSKEVTVDNNHKAPPPEQITKNPLLAAPMLLQRMILINLQWYMYDLIIKYRKGKKVYLRDILSRSHCI